MPLTFPSHAAAVLPLKLWRPRWFDGVALVIGSAAPDLPYALEPYVHIRAHLWWALVWFCVPVSVVASALVRWAAPTVAGHLPDGGGFALRDYAVLGRSRHRLPVIAASAWLGAVSHRLWDVVTHASIDRGQVRIDWLSDPALAGQPWWRIFHYGSTVLGAVGVLLAARHIGRRRLLIRWHGAPAPVPIRPRLFWSVTGGAWAAGLALMSLLRETFVVANLLVRLLLLAALALLAATATVRWSVRRADRDRRRSPISVASPPGVLR
jgi:hypothetical protein